MKTERENKILKNEEEEERNTKSKSSLPNHSSWLYINPANYGRFGAFWIPEEELEPELENIIL